MSVETTPKSAFSEYLRLLCRLHEMMVAGQGDSDDADALRDDMDQPWYQMTAEEIELAGGLSEDLYALEEGGPRQVEMSPEDKRQYHEEANRVLGKADTLLQDGVILSKADAIPIFAFLRRPIPTTVPKSSIPFLQARTWARLGEFEIALRFIKKAEELEPRLAVLVMQLLKEMSRLDEAAEYADKIVAEAQRASRQVAERQVDSLLQRV